MTLFSERFNYLPYIDYNYTAPRLASFRLSDETVPSSHVSPNNSSRNPFVRFFSDYLPFQWFLKIIKWEQETNRIENAKNIILEYTTDESDYDDTLTIDSEEDTQLNRNYSPRYNTEYIVDDNIEDNLHYNYGHSIRGRHLSI